MSRAAGDAASVSGSGAASLFGPSSTSSPPVLHIDYDFRKSLAEINSMLATNVANWLKKRGKSLRPKLSEEQRKQLEECFELMDADGSGAIDADELGAAFKLLGLEVSRAEIADMLSEVDEDGSGECEYPEFVEIMTSTLAKLSHKREEQAGGNQVPFALLATAYRRKRIMEGLFTGDREVMAQVTQMAETATRRPTQEAQRQHQQQLQAARQRHTGSSSSSQPSPTGRHSSIFRSANSSANGSVGDLNPGTGQPSDPSTTAAAVAAAGEARAAQLAAQAGVSSGLLRALQHVKSFCSTHSGGSSAGSPLSSPTVGRNPDSKGPSMVHSGGPLLMPVPVLQPAPAGLHRSQAAAAAAAAAAAGTAAAAAAVEGGGAFGGHSISFIEDDGLVELPVEAIAGALDIEEQRQLISLLRAKTRKCLEIMATAAAAAGQPGASASGAKWPTLAGSSSTAGLRSVAGVGAAASAAGAACDVAGGVSAAGVGGGGGAGEGSSKSADAAGLQGLVGAKQRMTSKLMLKLLTQDVEPPKFALSTPSQRSMSGCSSRSASPSPTPGCVLRSCKSACGSPSPSKVTPAALLAAEYTSSSLQRSAPGAAGQDEQANDTGAVSRSEGGAGLRRGINFGDTQIYEYEQPARGRGGPSNNNSRRSSRAASRRSSRSSDGGGGSISSGGGVLTGIHRSKSLGALLMNGVGHLSAPGSGVRGQVSGSGGGVSPPGGGQLRAPQGKAVSRSPSSKGSSNNDSISSSGVGGRSPARRSSMSVHRRDLSAAALQQVGSMYVLPDGAGAGQQQQQQWLAVPQLPRMAGAAQSCLAHLQRSKSSSPVSLNSIANSSSAAVVRPGMSPVGALVGSPSRPGL